MTHRNIKIGVTVAGARARLYRAALVHAARGTEYYKHVDEVMTNPQQWQGKQLQLHGYVVPGSILREARTRSNTGSRCRTTGARDDAGNVIDASYTGIVPDTFKDEAEVVLRASSTPEGFHTDPNGVMAKCPSKYEAQTAGSGT